jgi:tetratricopeptide (TPR) repeat protein
LCDTAEVMRTSAQWMIAAALVSSVLACKPKQTVEPEKEWTPDETVEPEQASADVAPEMSEEEKLAKAKELYVEAEGKAKEGAWTDALGLYEQAYYLVPSKHGFALKVGVAAEKAGDCAKAITYYEHFLKYAETDKYADDIATTKKSLAALQKKGC